MKEEVVAPMILPVMGHHQHTHPQQQQHPHHHPHHHHLPPLSQPSLGGHKVPQSMDHCQETEGPGLYADKQSQQQYVPAQQLKEVEDECLSLREAEAKMKQQLIESQRRERLMMRRLAAKEQELLDYVNQVAELKSVQTPGQTALKAAVLDPAVNVLFQKLKQELQTTQARLEETQNELAAWKFTPDSNTGKRLMAKCRLLHQENEELGKLTSNGRLAKLESELAMQRGVSEDLKKSHCDLDEVLLELEEDVEGMQNTILLMQRELKVEKERSQSIERDNSRMLAVLREKPEWLAAVQAATVTEEQQRLKQEHAELRLNGDDSSAVSAAVKDEHVAEQAVQGVRTPPLGACGAGGAVTVSLVEEDAASRTADSASEVAAASPSQEAPAQPATNGKQVLESVLSGAATRKRTRSSVAGSGEVVGEEPPADEAPEEGSACLKRNRYSTIVNSDKSGAPRTRGQLQQQQQQQQEASAGNVEKAKLELIAEPENGQGGGGGDGGGVSDDGEENVAEDPLRREGSGGATTAAAVSFSSSNNNNNNNGNKLLLSNFSPTGETGEENGSAATTTVEALKLKLENGSSGGGGGGGGIELNHV